MPNDERRIAVYNYVLAQGSRLYVWSEMAVIISEAIELALTFDEKDSQEDLGDH